MNASTDKSINVLEVHSRLSTHEEVCAFRYESINARLKRLEQILLATAGTIILFLLTHLVK
jgi:hypothetical protein